MLTAENAEHTCTHKAHTCAHTHICMCIYTDSCVCSCTRVCVCTHRESAVGSGGDCGSQAPPTGATGTKTPDLQDCQQQVPHRLTSSCQQLTHIWEAQLSADRQVGPTPVSWSRCGRERVAPECQVLVPGPGAHVVWNGQETLRMGLSQSPGRGSTLGCLGGPQVPSLASLTERAGQSPHRRGHCVTWRQRWQ